jgi:tetratricopeptide (TPR) repeat protein
MKATFRWFVWVMALSGGAALGIALAGGEEEEAVTPAECVRRLSDPDWRVRSAATRALRTGGVEAYKALFTEKNPHPEARFRIALLKKELAPLHGGWKHALEAGRASLDRQDMDLALKYLLIAARKNPPLRTDAWVAQLCTRAWAARPEGARDKSGREDWELFLCGEHAYLAGRFPQSPLREKSLFLAGRYEAVLSDYPDGVYAPLAKYSRTAGHPYFEPPAYLEIRDPAREAAAWPKFLREHPGHPGSDDAAYRLGRALEKLSRFREAVTWLMRSARLPDGEFSWKGPLRALYVMDASASEADLRVLAREGASRELREKARVTLGVRALRRGAFVEARDVWKAFLEDCTQSAFREKVAARVKDLETVLIPAAERLKAGEAADEALYALGRYFYHRVLALYNPVWEGNRVNYFSYEVNCLGRSHAFRNPPYFESHNNYLRAATYFDRLWKEYPDSPWRAKALYSSGTAHFRASSLNQFSVFHRTRAQLLGASEARYVRLASEHAGDPLAPAAKKMVRVVRNTPKDSWR